MQALTSQEYVVFHIPASSFKGLNAAFGRMRITNRRILFDPADDAAADASMDVEFGLVERIEKCNTFLVVPNGLKLSLVDGETRIFAIRNRMRVIRYIQKRIPSGRRKLRGGN